MLNLLFFCSGIVLAGYLPTLPSPVTLLSAAVPVLFVSILFFRKFRPVLWAVLFFFGLCYGIFSGYRLLANQLPHSLAEKDLVAEGQVVGLPQENDRRQLFTLKVDRAYFPYDYAEPFTQFPHKINVSSYTNLRVKTGEQWRLTVKLKRPRGFVNPGGFDYQVSLLRRDIGATGYIRQGLNERLKTQPKFSMDVLRYDLQQWLLNASSSPQKSILVALLVGDTSLVDKDQWGQMIKTGTNHLIAISGLHLGFFAIVGFFFGNLIGRSLQSVWSKFPSVFYGCVCSVIFTLFYSLLAGFNIPTIRTLIMLMVVQLALLWRRSFFASYSLVIALVLVLLYDPLAAYDMGFWLSFVAVAMLIFCFSGRISTSLRSGVSDATKNYLVVFAKSQWVMFIGLLIPLSLLIHTSSLLAPPANFVAIPVITFFVVPCLIISALSHFLFPFAESFFLHCSEWGMLVVHEWLSYLLKLGEGKFNPLLNLNPLALGLAIIGVFLILSPRGLGNKYLGGFGIILALVIPLNQLPSLQMLVFDVGQGTAVLVRTPHHQLLYDTGPVYTENFDAGSGIIVPYLQSQGINYLEHLVVSHNDLDHLGGLAGVLASTDVDDLWLGEPEKYQAQSKPVPVDTCHSQKPWQWDGVNFAFIRWPLKTNAKANNHSCVLMVEFNNHKILLTGDIEKDVERSLVEQGGLSPVEVLLAPHHGSHTSSTPEFVAKLQPKVVVYSAGYHNQHGHPHADVQARYLAQGSRPLNTATGGALTFSWVNDDAEIREYRLFAKRYWFDDTYLQ
ncbi:DNA internalization-related competence protein ComEC/Rec2 [Cellvibrio sp.]|uniref:DNA internalization-related competence protein ComEC/Rec2 n=1 Tax=Cellvibrio sp. TaxID=1965322 RepID=UPI0039647A05